jgi:hypothetical protein
MRAYPLHRGDQHGPGAVVSCLADDKPNARLIVSQAIVEALDGLDMLRARPGRAAPAADAAETARRAGGHATPAGTPRVTAVARRRTAFAASRIIMGAELS